MRKIDELFIKAASKGAAVRESLVSRFKKDKGSSEIIVTIGLMVIALVILVVMKDKITSFVNTLVDSMTTKATGILNGN